MNSTNKRWQYGDSWERYPIADGETWSHELTRSQIAVADIRDPLPSFMYQADMIYTDPPWSKGNANSFVTKAGLDSYVDSFGEFMDAFFGKIGKIRPNVCYLEVGKQHRQDFRNRLAEQFATVQEWQITYYRKHPCYLIRAATIVSPQMEADFTGLDDEVTPQWAIGVERPACVADLCTGRGLTLLAAHRCGARFVGTELNRRRLAVAIDRAAKQGVRYAKNPAQ